MITNTDSLTTFKREWNSVARMRETIDHLVISTSAFDEVASPIFGNILYNLPFLLAVEVLTRVLLQAREEKGVQNSEAQLGELLNSEKNSLQWINWQCLYKIAARKTELSRDGRLFEDKQCQQDIANIEAQLVVWGVITAF